MDNPESYTVEALFKFELERFDRSEAVQTSQDSESVVTVDMDTPFWACLKVIQGDLCGQGVPLGCISTVLKVSRMRHSSNSV